MGSESYFELLHSRVKSAQAPTISGPNIDRIQTKQAGYSETACCNCAATKRCQEPMKTLCGLCYLLAVFLHGTANFCARYSRSSKGNDCQLRQASGAWQTAQTRTSIVVYVWWAKNTDFKPPQSHICRHAPENPQDRAAWWCYTSHSRLLSHHRPPTAPYEPNSAKVHHFWVLPKFDFFFNLETIERHQVRSC